jgi:hypothetical protein
VAAVVPEDHAQTERVSQWTERADKRARVRTGAAVEDEAGCPLPHDLGVERGPIDR